MSEQQPETHGGGGKFFERRDNVRSDARLIEQAARNKWNIPAAAFDVLPAQVVRMAVDPNEQPRNRLAAARAVIAMHGQNQGEQPQAGTTVNVAVVNQIKVNETDDWYGTKAARRDVAESDGSPAIGNPVAGAIQSGSVRPALGQNGVGTNGHAKGPRSDEGPATGSH